MYTGTLCRKAQVFDNMNRSPMILGSASAIDRTTVAVLLFLGLDVNSVTAFETTDAAAAADPSTTYDAILASEAGIQYVTSLDTDDETTRYAYLLDADIAADPIAFEAAVNKARNMFADDGSILGAPDYRTSILPAATPKASILVIDDGTTAKVAGLPSYDSAAWLVNRLASCDTDIPARQLVAKPGDAEILVVNETDMAQMTRNGRYSDTSIKMPADTKVVAIGRGKAPGYALVQASNGCLYEVENGKNGVTLHDAPLTIDEAYGLNDGATWIGLTSAVGDGSSHALIMKPIDGGSKVQIVAAPILSLAPVFGVQTAQG